MSYRTDGWMQAIEAVVLVVGFVLAGPASGNAEETIAKIDTYGIGKVSRTP